MVLKIALKLLFVDIDNYVCTCNLDDWISNSVSSKRLQLNPFTTSVYF